MKSKSHLTIGILILGLLMCAGLGLAGNNDSKKQGLHPVQHKSPAASQSANESNFQQASAKTKDASADSSSQSLQQGFGEVMLPDGTLWRYRLPAPVDTLKMDLASPSDTVTKLEMLEPLRNGVNIYSDASAEAQPIDRSADMALGTFFQQVPAELVGDDTVHLGVGSFSIKPDSPFNYENWLKSVRNWWDASRANNLAMDKIADTEAAGYYIIKLDRAVAQPDPDVVKKQLEGSGVRFVGPVSSLTYIAHMPRGLAAQASALPGVLWAGPFLPAYKIAPEVGRVRLPLALAGLDEFELTVLGFPGEDLSGDIRNLGGQVIGTETADWFNLYYVRINRFMIPALAQIEGVQMIQEVAPRHFDNEITPSSCQTAGFGSAANRPLWLVGVDGRSQIAGIMDGEFQTYNSAFATDCNTPFTWNASAPSHRKVVWSGQELGNTPDNSCVSITGTNHGTQTAGNIAGNASTYNATTNPYGCPSGSCNFNTDYDGDSFPDLDGVARNARLALYNSSTTGGEASGHSGLIGAGAKVINKSYGYPSYTYDSDSVRVDTVLYGNAKQMVMTISAGNDGDTTAISSPGLAKNDITVGANYQMPGLFKLTDFSSKGPETNSRMGPTLCQVGYAESQLAGSNEWSSASCYSSSGTAVKCSACEGAGGTSFSAPFTAGMVELVRDYFYQGFYPQGEAIAANSMTVTGPLVKAALIAATDVITDVNGRAGQAAGARFGNLWGYGVPILKNVLPLSANTTMVPGLKVWDNSASEGIGGDGHAGPDNYTLKVQAGTWPLRIALVWYDPPGSVGSGALLNNINLLVTAPDGKTYRGNKFTGAYSTLNPGTYDTVNPAELVIIDPAAVQTGTYTIQVNVTTVTSNDTTYKGQTYSLLAAGPVVGTSTITLNQPKYSCTDTMVVTVRDPNAGHDAAFVSANTLISTNNPGGDSLHATFAGTSGTYTATVPIESGAVNTGDAILQVSAGKTITVAYTDGDTNPQVTRLVNCAADLVDGGYAIRGGCDEAATRPALDHLAAYHTEFFRDYMDVDEYIAYTFGIYNGGMEDLTDVRVTLTPTGAGASAVQILGDNPIYVGRISAQSLSGAVFHFHITTVAAQTAVNLQASITSPADGFTTPVVITQTHYLESDDLATQQTACFLHNTPTETWSRANYGSPGIACGWTANAITDPLCTYENRADCLCGAPAGDHIHKSGPLGTNCTGTFPTGCDEVLFGPIFGPVSTAAGTYFDWRWHSFFWAGDMVDSGNAYYTGVDILQWHHQWNSVTRPTVGEAVDGFPYSIALHEDTDDGAGNVFDFEPANTGACGHTSVTDPPNQDFVGLGGVGLNDAGTDWIPITTSTKWIFAHEFVDYTDVTDQTKGLGLDNEEMLWDEFIRGDDSGSCTGKCGVVGLDRFAYENCPVDSVVVSVMDGTASGSVSVTVTAGSGDSETITLTETGTDTYYFTATLPIAWTYGTETNDGTLYVLPEDIILATYNDLGEVCSDTASAYASCPGGDVVYVSNAFVSDNGDGDHYPDTKETYTFDITIQNNMATALTNAYVSIDTTTPSVIDCIPDNTAYYGTVAASATATNPTGDRFTIHVASTANCTDFQYPPKAGFVVHIRGDNFYGSATVQSFTMTLDLNDLTSGYPTYTLSQTFSTDPIWATGATPNDEGGTTCVSFSNNFRYRPDGRAAGNGAYGAWQGIGGTFTAAGSPTGLPDGIPDSSTVYSPVLYAAGTSSSLSFDIAYELSFLQATFVGQGAKVQYSLNGGAWTNLAFTTPAQVTLTQVDDTYCNPFDDTGTARDSVWWNNATSFVPNVHDWSTTSASAVATAAGNSLQFRWRVGAIDIPGFSGYKDQAGLGIDNVTITNLQSHVDCDTTNNSGLPGCSCTMVVDVTPSGTTQVFVNESITFTASVTNGTYPFWYQWTEGGTDIPGATGSTLTVTKSAAESNVYNCKVTDYSGNCIGVVDASAPTGEWLPPAPLIEYDGTFNPLTTLIQVCGDDDGYIEPGEQWTVYARLKNVGVDDATGVTADLAVNSGSAVLATITLNPGAFGSIPIGGTATNSADPWQFQVESEVVCPENLIFDVINIASTGTPSYTYDPEQPAFTVVKGASWSDSSTANPAAANKNYQDGNYSPAFTVPPAADTASVTYSWTYVQDPGGSRIFWQDDDPANSTGYWGTRTNITSNTGAHCTVSSNVYAVTADTANLTSVDISTVGYTGITVTLDERVWRATPNPATCGTWSYQYSLNGGSSWSTSTALPWDCSSGQAWTCNTPIALPAGANNITNLRIRFTYAGTVSRVGHIDNIRVSGTASPGGSWTSNAKTDLVAPDGVTTTPLKAYGVSEPASAGPYDVVAFYNLHGAGTYRLRVTETYGGTADVTTSTMAVARSECDYSNCGTPTVTPGSLYNTGALRLSKSGADILATWTAPGGTCAPTGYAVYEGTLGNYYSHNNAVTCVDTNANLLTEPITMPAGDAYFLVVPISNTDEGSYGTTGDGVERPQSSAKCKTPQITTACN